MNPREVLLVANVTATWPALATRVKAMMAEAPTRFTLLVPASTTSEERTLTWEESEVWHRAEVQMQRAVEQLGALGAEIEGVVGDPDPMNAVRDLLLTRRFDLLVVSTLSERRSPWIGASLPERLSRETGLDVIHVVNYEEHAPAPA